MATFPALPAHFQPPDGFVVPDDIPAGFVPLNVGGPWLRHLGQLWFRRDDDGNPVIALRAEAGHLNIQGMTHGGMLTTLADGALSISVAIARERRGATVTVSLTADVLASGRLGDWLEAHVRITKLGSRLAYANCDVKVGSKHLLRSSGVFALNDRALPAPTPGGEAAPLSDG